MLQTGESLGDWIIDGALGQGATGSVYRCHHVVTGRLRAAIKVIRLSDVQEGGRWFLREVEALARLSHPSIVAIRTPGMDVQRGLLYIAMELVEGETLLNILRRGPLPPSTFRRLLGRVAEALAFAHDHGIYHRDIKPSNIMLRPDGSPVVVDFGVAVDLEAGEDGPESRIGTPSYMPPEAFLSGAVDPAKADVYAFGVLMFESLTGRRAFDRAAGGDETQYRAIRRQKLTINELDPGEGIPDDIRVLVRAATAPWPDQRQISMALLAGALLRAVEGPAGTLIPPEDAFSTGAGFGGSPTPSGAAMGSQPTVPRLAPSGADSLSTMVPREARQEFARWVTWAAVAAVILSLLAGDATWLWLSSLK